MLKESRLNLKKEIVGLSSLRSVDSSLIKSLSEKFTNYTSILLVSRSFHLILIV